MRFDGTICLIVYLSYIALSASSETAIEKFKYRHLAATNHLLAPLAQIQPEHAFWRRSTLRRACSKKKASRRIKHARASPIGPYFILIAK